MSARKTWLQNSTTDEVCKELWDTLVTERIAEGTSEDPQIFMA